MTDDLELIAGRCVVITTRESPIKPQIEALVAELQSSRALDFDHIYLEEVFPQSDASSDSFALLVHQLIHSQLAIVDLCVTAEAFYVMGIRHSMNNRPNLMLAPSADTAKAANARFTNSRQSYIDVSQEGWMGQVDRLLMDFDQPQLKEYQSDLQATRAFSVTPREFPFTASKRHSTEWELNHPGNPVKKTGGPRIVIWEYEIQAAKEFEVWVNSENTFMEMARFWDRSVSAQIRKRGAVRRGALSDESFKDALGLALAEKVGTRSQVPIGTVFMTPTNSASTLRKFNKVNYVAHLAAVTPIKGDAGFTSGGKITECVQSVFEEIAKERKSKRVKNALSSVLFPLIGSGDGGAHPGFVAHQMVISLQKLIALALAEPETLSRKERATQEKIDLLSVETIGLIAYQRSHLGFLRRELANSGFAEVKT